VTATLLVSRLDAISNWVEGEKRLTHSEFSLAISHTVQYRLESHFTHGILGQKVVAPALYQTFVAAIAHSYFNLLFPINYFHV
jgi:hypothetical protein